MTDIFSAALESNKTKVRQTVALVRASLADYLPFDPRVELSPKALEPYVVHDYLPEQTAEMFAMIAGEFGSELLKFDDQLQGRVS